MARTKLDMSFLYWPVPARPFTGSIFISLIASRSAKTLLEALRTATLNPARFLGLHNSGFVGPNARADLILLDANPLEDVRNTQRIVGVVLRGKYLDRTSLDQLLRDSARLAEKY